MHCAKIYKHHLHKYWPSCLSSEITCLFWFLSHQTHDFLLFLILGKKLLELSFVVTFDANNAVAAVVHCLYWAVTTPKSAKSLWKATHHNIYLPRIPWSGFARDPWTARLKYALQNIDVKCPGDVDFGFGNLVERLRSAPSLQARCEWQPLGLNKLNTAKARHLLTSAQL